ncbi:MAG: hypothetical protein GY845_02025 [Planctomycetes bacterium]|nr:hypothetical protein [Planctomycetota bacterium]
MNIFKRIGWGPLVIAVVLGCAVYLTATLLLSDDLPFANWFSEDKSFEELVEEYDVIIMKHCYPASNILEDIGSPDPSSARRSIENYQAVYQLLRAKFDEHPDTMFIVWTLPPLHRLATDPDKAARATEFSQWMTTDFLTEDGPHPNIYVWDFRGIVMNPNTNFLKSKYERDHEISDSHPNDTANNVAGPQFAKFIVDSIAYFTSGITSGQEAKIIFLHHSTGRNVYKYPDLGIPDWFDNYNDTNGTEFEIYKDVYPSKGNMPVYYYRKWIAN